MYKKSLWNKMETEIDCAAGAFYNDSRAYQIQKSEAHENGKADCLLFPGRGKLFCRPIPHRCRGQHRTGGEPDCRTHRRHPVSYPAEGSLFRRLRDLHPAGQGNQKAKARPQLAALPEGLDGYEEIYLGYPNYWGDMPMAVYTFLEAFDWTGKTVHPFCTHEGSGLSGTEQTIAAVCQGARVTGGLAIRGTDVPSCADRVRAWVGGC